MVSVRAGSWPERMVVGTEGVSRAVEVFRCGQERTGQGWLVRCERIEKHRGWHRGTSTVERTEGSVVERIAVTATWRETT